MQRRFLFFTILMFMALVSCAQTPQSDNELFKGASGKSAEITILQHASLMMNLDGVIVYVDPVAYEKVNYSALPKADIILIGHSHGDHYDPKVIDSLSTAETLVYGTEQIAQLSGFSYDLPIGTVAQNNFSDKVKISSVPAYNYSEGRTNFHPKGNGYGFVIEFDGLKFYVAGDTEDVPELAELNDKKIDVAFLPVNQPYTMTCEQCINAISMFNPRIVYPYHFSNTDLTPLIETFKDSKTTEIRVRDWYNSD